VLKKGQVVESGTHDSLLENSEGVYYGLVHAQQLSLGEPTEENEDEPQEEEIGAILSREKSAAKSDTEATQQKKGVKEALFSAFGRVLYEQRAKWPFYLLTVVFAGFAAGMPFSQPHPPLYRNEPSTDFFFPPL
jgi:ATP-binding cassette, subfamily B (MDR/TAP), member 1